MTARHFTRLVVATMALGLVACTRTLPRRTVPEAEMPSVDLSRPSPTGTGRLVVDVPEASVPVSRMTVRNVPDGEHFRLIEEPSEVCPATPCVLDLPVGNVLLAFPVLGNEGALSTPELVHVSGEASVFRRNLDLYAHDRRALYRSGGIFMALSFVAMIAGLIVGQNAAEGDPGSTDRLVGRSMLIGGAALMIPSTLMLYYGSPTQTPGSSVHFPVR